MIRVTSGFSVNEDLMATPLGAIPAGWDAPSKGVSVTVAAHNGSNPRDVYGFYLQNQTGGAAAYLSKSFAS